MLTGFHSAQRNPQQLRRIKYYHAESDKASVFLTNNFSLPASTIAKPARWQVEQFFKWIKQHQHIKAFFGTSDNAVKCQIWIAVSGCVLVAIIEKRLDIDASLYRTLQILGLPVFERIQLNHALADCEDNLCGPHFSNQLNLFNQTLGHW